MVFLFAITAFKTGESSSMVDIVWAFDYRLNRTIPFDPLPSAIKLGFMFVLPLLYTTGVTVSVALSLSDARTMILAVSCTAIAAVLIQKALWRRALAGYSSASS